MYKSQEEGTIKITARTTEGGDVVIDRSLVVHSLGYKYINNGTIHIYMRLHIIL